MSHLVGIDKGPVMDWTNDSGLDECYRKWKKQVEVLFRGPLNGVTEAVKCNYMIYWSGDHGMDLVDKWTTEGKINDGNKEMLNTYWKHFEQYIHPQANQLIAVVELKRLFQGPLSLEDFHTKAMRLVTQAGYEGDANDQVLRDTIISGIASDKIRAKIVKEGHTVKLNQVMEIAKLEVSTQQHLDRMQETAKVNYVQYGKSTKSKKGKKSTQSGASGSSHRGDRGHGTSSKPSGKGRKLPFPQDTCYRCGKGSHQKVQDCKALDVVCRGCGKKGHFEKVCLTKHSTHSLELPQASTSTAGAGASEPLYFDDEGQPVNTYMVSVPHVNKHLIKFPIALDYLTLRGRNKMEHSTGSTGHSNCFTMHSPPQSVLLKADTGADVNLMNRKTFDQLFGEAKVLQPTPIRMENYGNTAVNVLGMFHVFLRWKDEVHKKLFYMTDCDRSPNLLSRDACYTLGVLKPCYTVENSTDSTDSTHASNKSDLVAESFLHQKMKESERKLSNCSNKWSISKSQLQGGPLKKQDILDIYSDVFTGIGKFPGLPYKFQFKPNAKPASHAPRKVPIHLQDAFHEEIRNLEALGILEETKDVTEWVNSFVIIEKKIPINSNNSHSPGHSMNKKLRICLDPRDLNEALEREPYYTCSIEEIMGKFHGMTRFTIADFNKGYWMVELDPESRKYTMMALDIGRFQWTQLPMGSIVAQDVFQRKLDAIFLSVPGVTGIADDMIIYGRSDLEHDKHLINFLEVCRKNTLTLNPDKMQFRLPQVSFFGHQWSAKGLSPDPKKIAAVKRMNLPQDVEMMKSFLGLVNYLNRYSLHLAELSEPLRQICRQNMEFELTESVCVAFSRTKEEISKNVTPPYFNPKSATTLQTDASKKGLGAVILQDSKPVMFASRALTGSERNYQNLERECLATIWEMEKFHYFYM